MEKQKYAVWATRAGKLSYFRIFKDYENGLLQVAAMLAAGHEEAGITGEPEEIPVWPGASSGAGKPPFLQIRQERRIFVWKN